MHASVWRKLGPGRFLLIQDVKDRTELWIDGTDLQHLTGLAVTHVDSVIEIESTRRLRADPTALQARLREDQHLR